MVRGADYNFVFTVKNRGTGQPVVDPSIVADIRLALGSSASKQPIKGYSVGSGIQSLGDGRFSIAILAVDTLRLPDAGKAYLQGFVLPVGKSLKFDLGNITTNLANNLPADE